MLRLKARSYDLCPVKAEGGKKTESGGAGVALRQRSELGWMESPGYQGGSERRGVCACNEK